MSRLLVVDDEPNVLYSLEKSLTSETVEVVTTRTGKHAIELVDRWHPDTAILDVRLPDMSGLDVFDHIRQLDPRLPVIVISAYAATDTAIEAMKRGAYEYLLKPLNLRRLRDVVTKALELSRLRHVPAVFEDAVVGPETADRIVGRSAGMQEVAKAIGRVASLDVTVLIQGESGTGKELIARALYHHSNRKAEPFLALNCAAIPETMLESELFGHERAAFTGAERRRIGKFEQANKGTIFLDEIGDMTPATQAKVLRLLQDQRFERLGGNETIQTDVRVIAATNQNLEELVRSARFREDLFYRLKVFTIRVPPLRERLEDLPILVEYFIKLFNQHLGKQVHSALPEALEALRLYHWPGNIRELQNIVKEGLIKSSGEFLTMEDLPAALRDGKAADQQTAVPPTRAPLDIAQLVNNLLQAGEPDVYRRVCLEVDRIILETTLRFAKGSQMQASDMLGIARSTLRAKLRELGMVVERQWRQDANGEQ